MTTMLDSAIANPTNKQGLSNRLTTKSYRLIMGDWRDCWYELFPLRVLWCLTICLALLLCLSVTMLGPKIENVENELEIPANKGSLCLLYGLVRVELFREGETMVHFLHSLLLRSILGPIGVLVSLAGAASLMPGFFRSGSAILVLSSPVSRFGVVMARYLGALIICGGFGTLLSISTALALDWSTGYWPGFGLAAVLIYVAQVAAFLPMSMVLGTWLRRSSLALAGSVLFWLVCQAVNLAYWQVRWQDWDAASNHALALAYWFLPKPADMMLALDTLSGASRHFASWPELQWAWEADRIHLGSSILSSLASSWLLLVVAGLELRSTEIG